MTELNGVSSAGVGFEKCDIRHKVDEMPLMGSPIPTIAIFVAYIAFIYKVGPHFMRGREAFGLKRVMLVYNFIQVVLAAFMFYKYFSYMWRTDFLFLKCNISNPDFCEEILYFIWLYHVVKISDFLDTVFFVLRKKYNQITFLHVYHHSLMMVGTWFFLKHEPSETVIFTGCLNSLVHIFMYGYYGLAALGPRMAPYLTWKKYLTSIQLVQFGVQIIHYVITMKYSGCPPSTGVGLFTLMNLIVFLVLFCNFYKENYRKKDKSVLN